MATQRWISGIALALGIAAASTTSAQTTFTTIPAQPRAGEEFLVKFSLNMYGVPAFLGGVSATAGNQVDLAPRYAGISDLATQPFGLVEATIAAVAPTAGTYALRYVATGAFNGVPNSSAPTPLGTLTVIANPSIVQPQYTALSGLYYDPTRPGSGMTLEQGVSGKLFAAIFAQAISAITSNEPVWYTMPGGSWVTETRYRGALYQARGTPVGGAYDPTRQVNRAIGLLTLDFTAANTVTLSLEGTTLPLISPLTKFRF